MTRSRHRQHVKGRPAGYRPAARAGPAAARRMVESAWAWLDAPQQVLLRGRFWRGLSVDEIAAAWGLTPAAVRQAEAAALLLCRRVITGLYDPGTGDALPMPAAH